MKYLERVKFHVGTLASYSVGGVVKPSTVKSSSNSTEYSRTKAEHVMHVLMECFPEEFKVSFSGLSGDERPALHDISRMT